MHRFSTSGQRIGIVIAGTGGQGVLTSARLLSEFFLHCRVTVVSGQVHGMAQRGGSVQSTVMVNCGSSPMIRRGSAGVVLGFEPVECTRALPLVAAGALVVLNTTPVIPYVVSQQLVLGRKNCEYPELETLRGAIRAVTPNTLAFDATELAVSAGSIKTLNMVMLGSLFGCGLLPWPAEEFARVSLQGAPRGLRESNARAFELGVAQASHWSQGCPGTSGELQLSKRRPAR